MAATHPALRCSLCVCLFSLVPQRAYQELTDYELIINQDWQKEVFCPLILQDRIVNCVVSVFHSFQTPFIGLYTEYNTNLIHLCFNYFSLSDWKWKIPVFIRSFVTMVTKWCKRGFTVLTHTGRSLSEHMISRWI